MPAQSESKLLIEDCYICLVRQLNIRARIVILVDDGLATGAMMRTALGVLKPIG
jgi:predicted phosphoribosyltransferase